MAILAQYFLGRDEGYLFITGAAGGTLEIIRFPLGAMNDGIVDYFKRLDEQGEQKAGEALKSLVQPIVEHSVEDELVWIVPHGILHYLPFHAIPTTEGFSDSAIPFVIHPAHRYCPFAGAVQDSLARQ